MTFKIVRKLLFSLLIISSYFVVANDNKIILATTTSTENSGLLRYLLPMFEDLYNIKIKVIATGTGKAMELAKRGNVDAVIVHAPKKEQQFVEQGYGVERRNFMYNYFVVVGPKSDLANVADAKSVDIAFKKIALKQTNFISRADGSGTHTKEKDIWHKANIKPSGSWYKEVGQGMGKTLQIADELDGYTLVDSGTWLNLKDKTELKLLYVQSPLLLNPYSIILVNPQKHPHTRYKLSKIFASWISSEAVKVAINNYKRHGEQLFFAK